MLPSFTAAILTTLSLFFAGQVQTASSNEHQARGLMLLEMNDLDGAIDAFTKAIEHDEALPRTLRGATLDRAISVSYHNRGTARLRKGDLDGAIADFSIAVALNPDYRDAYGSRGNARALKGDAEGAIADYTKAIEIAPHAESYYNRARAKLGQRDVDGAVVDYSAAIQINPRHVYAYVYRARARGQKGDLDGAMADVTRAIEIDPTVSDAYLIRGLTRGTKGDVHGSIADFDKAIAIDPALADAYLHRAFARETTKDLDGAIADYSKTIELNPSNSAAYENRGNLLDDRGDSDAAIADYTKAIEITPARGLPYYNRGYTVMKKGKLSEAMVDFDTALKLDPTISTAYLWRGWLRLATGDLEGSLGDAEKRITLTPRAHDGYALRGLNRLSQGQDLEAEQDFRKCYEINPGSRAAVEKAAAEIRTRRSAPPQPPVTQATERQSETSMVSTADSHKHMGKSATVCGEVVGFEYAVAEEGIETILYLDRPQSEAIFAIRILGGRRQAFKPPPEKQYGSQETCVTGTITTKDSLTHIEVEKPEQLFIRESRSQLQKRPDGLTLMPGDRVSAGRVLPKPIRQGNPSYTSAALKAGISGVVEVEALVLADGTVGQVEVTRSLDPLLGLDEEAIRAVKEWVFEPGTYLGKPVPVLVTIELTFRPKAQSNRQ